MCKAFNFKLQVMRSEYSKFGCLFAKVKGMSMIKLESQKKIQLNFLDTLSFQKTRMKSYKTFCVVYNFEL